MIKVYRCRICGEIYLGEERPMNCPWCGALIKHIIDIKRWDFPEFELTAIELSDVSKKHLARARELEIDNANFYNCAKKKSKNLELYSLFKRLSKVELEHAELISKTLGEEIPAISEIQCSEVDSENIKDAHRRETRAINYYSLAASEVPEPRTKEIFNALVEIEKTHLEKTENY